MREALIDTDILSYYFKGDKQVEAQFSAYLDDFPNIQFSLITYYEIISGLQYKKATRRIQLFELFVQENTLLPLTKNSAKIGGDIYKILRNKGITIDDMDVLIASIALENSLVLVTNNIRHFEHIPGLLLENWKG